MKIIPSHVFRGYDLRGLVDKELTEQNIEHLGRAYATWLIKRRIYDCVTGHDCRLSSPAFHHAMIKGLIDSGITVYDIGITLSQIAYFGQYVFRTRGMVMITASHNPKEYNGFKFGTGFSETMLTHDIENFKKIVYSNKFEKRGKKGKHIKQDIFSIYLKDLLRHTDAITKMKVVIDSCAATTGLFLPKILRAVGCEVIEQNTTPDGNFPVGTPDPTERVVQERLAKRVIAEKADIGFSYDCDGDRIGVVDNKGNLLWNDTLVSIYAKDILEYLPGSPIVYNTLCSRQVKEVILINGGEPIIWLTGHSFIKAKVREVGAPFGGELSGHFYFTDNYYGHDDGAIASLRLLSYLSRKKKSLSDEVAGLPQYISSPEIKLGCPDDIKFSLISNTIANELKGIYSDAQYTEIDGIRVDTDTEMVIIRASQNGPYITVKFEAKEIDKYNLLKKKIKEILKKIDLIDFSTGVNTKAFD